MALSFLIIVQTGCNKFQTPYLSSSAVIYVYSLRQAGKLSCLGGVATLVATFTIILETFCTDEYFNCRPLQARTLKEITSQTDKYLSQFVFKKVCFLRQND